MEAGSTAEDMARMFDLISFYGPSAKKKDPPGEPGGSFVKI
jgi:hypothetical protein